MNCPSSHGNRQQRPESHWAGADQTREDSSRKKPSGFDRRTISSLGQQCTHVRHPRPRCGSPPLRAKRRVTASKAEQARGAAVAENDKSVMARSHRDIIRGSERDPGNGRGPFPFPHLQGVLLDLDQPVVEIPLLVLLAVHRRTVGAAFLNIASSMIAGPLPEPISSPRKIRIPATYRESSRRRTLGMLHRFRSAAGSPRRFNSSAIAYGVTPLRKLSKTHRAISASCCTTSGELGAYPYLTQQNTQIIGYVGNEDRRMPVTR